MGWAGLAKSRGHPSAGAPEFQAKILFFENNFPVTVKIGTSGYQTLECFITALPIYGRLRHVDETFTRFADVEL